MTPLDELLEAIIVRSHAAMRSEDSTQGVSDFHALALIVKDTRLRVLGPVASSPPASEEDPAKLPTTPDACHALERAAAAFEKAYSIAYTVWRTNITNAERDQLREVLRKSRRVVMKREEIR